MSLNSVADLGSYKGKMTGEFTGLNGRRQNSFSSYKTIPENSPIFIKGFSFKNSLVS
jgi:hypothetical protein